MQSTPRYAVVQFIVDADCAKCEGKGRVEVPVYGSKVIVCPVCAGVDAAGCENCAGTGSKEITAQVKTDTRRCVCSGTGKQRRGRLTASELDVHTAACDAVQRLAKKGVRVVSVSTAGRDPTPPVPADASAHVTAMRDAGLHEAADYVERLASVFAARSAEHQEAHERLFRAVPAGAAMSPVASVGEIVDAHLADCETARRANADMTEKWIALHNLHHIASDEENAHLITAQTVLDAFHGAETKRAARVARHELAVKASADRLEHIAALRVKTVERAAARAAEEEAASAEMAAELSGGEEA